MARSPALGRDFRLLWTAAAASKLGDGVFLTALPLLAVSLTRDPLVLSTVSFGFSAPWLVFALVSGALVDRWDRVAVMWRVDLLRFVLTAALTAVVVTGATTIPVLVGFAIALGAAETMFDTASLASIPVVVGTNSTRLARANARLEGADVVANGFVGPPVGAALFAVAAALPVAVNALSFLASTLLLRNVSSEQPPAARNGSTLRQEILAALRWLRAQPTLATLAVVVGVMNMGTAAAMTLLVLYLQDEAGLGTVYYGVVLVAAAAGALAGAVIAERGVDRLRPPRLQPRPLLPVPRSLGRGFSPGAR
jgi:MFS family permease